ncbi:sigma-54-dependent Fis family transcriptional regulator [Desulfallas sp. Bu1-1]|uniref:sigma-54-dependent transcriptional regulator n=1 Tax=Desulfallas sp. Bu1-1 TaxID=2787620 RepID=UPI0018A096BC|nr:sigma-54 dependent transcriptional regulator [Desulfallas sp. Bu1-1]MBF7082963.1 sigma-54-dependent Fis family transcriptional regulator [Desulfallas sp. Bu1-1]
MSTVLIVDDEEGVCELLRDVLEDAGFETWLAYNAKDAIEILESKTPDTILLDIRLPDADGIQLIEEFKNMGIHVPVILMTAFGTTEIAIQAMKQGAHDYLNKPLNLDELLITVQKAVKMQQLVSEVATLREELDHEADSVDNLIGQSRHMQDIFKVIGKVADSDITVLIQGESGTGKEVVARAIHNNSRRRNRPFIKINCGSIPEHLMESELFGHERGAFTGAIYQKPGKFELAHNGTVFLDEIGELSPHTQVKLLRVLQEKEFERVGGTKCIKVDVRILAATNRNLKQMVEEGNFREDLYYRVNVVNIKLPPLRERKEDIPLLLNYYLSKSARKYNKDISGISKEAMAVLKNYNWPGNVRELKNVCEQAVVMSRGPAILLEDLPLSGNGDLVLGNGNANTSIIVNNGRTLKEIVADVEKQVILKALNDNQWNRQETAKALGLNRRSLYAKMKEYNLL